MKHLKAEKWKHTITEVKLENRAISKQSMLNGLVWIWLCISLIFVGKNVGVFLKESFVIIQNVHTYSLF